MKNYITSVITDSMFDHIRQEKDMCLRWEALGAEFEQLEEVKFISAIKEEAVASTLRQRGLDVEANTIKIVLIPGDTVYVVNPGVKVHGLDSDELPEHALVTITKYWIEKTK